MIAPDTLRQMATFGAIGVLNTAIHLAVVMALVEGAGAGPVLANGAAFLCANAFSFVANSRWTFKAAPTVRRYGRFFSVSLLGLAVALGASALGERLAWHYLFGVLLSMVVMPLASYFANRHWTWKTRP